MACSLAPCSYELTIVGKRARRLERSTMVSYRLRSSKTATRAWLSQSDCQGGEEGTPWDHFNVLLL